MTHSKTRQPVRTVLWIGVLTVLLVVVGILLLRPPTIISNFAQCQQAGGAVLESYPEQCMIGGTNFTNSAQPPHDGSGYVGMREADALASAKKSNIPVRVVERDGEALPVTMDFVYNRHNLYIVNGMVYKVEVEGRANDLPAPAE